MKMKGQKLAAIVLAVLMAAAPVAGCASKNGDDGISQSAKTESGETETMQAEAKMTEINIITRQLGTAAHPDNEIWKELDKRLQDLGIKANIEYYPSTDYVTQCATIIAGGEYPAMMEWWNAKYPQELEDLSNDGIIRPLDELIDQYGPNIKKVRNEENSTFYHNSEDGKIYGVPARSQDLGNLHCYAVRQDWLDELNLKVPDNLDELYDTLKAFKEYKPDIIPFGVGSTTHFYLPIDIALSEYGITYDQWNVNENGELEYYAVMDRTKDAIAFVRKLYQEGLMEPEYVLLERDQLWDNMANGDYGVCAWYVDRLDSNTDAVATKYFEKNPGSRLTILNPFPDEAGVRRFPRMTNTQQMLIFSDASEEEAIACIKFLDYLYTDEGGDLADLGIEGKHWKKNTDGTKEILISTDEQKTVGYSMYNWMAKRSNLSPTVNAYSKEVADMMLAASVGNPVLNIVTDAAADYSSGLKSLVNTAITSMIMEPNIDLDKEFAEFVDTWYSSGGREWTDELNAAYQK